jgi:DNA-binding HxlR family transcriptional regulator
MGVSDSSMLAAEIPGVSRRMLTERLHELEAGGVVTRRVESGPPISVTYALADEAAELAAIDYDDPRR